jgi:hypothetical protein
MSFTQRIIVIGCAIAIISLIMVYAYAREDAWRQAGACDAKGGEMWIGWIGNNHLPVCGTIKEIQ